MFQISSMLNTSDASLETISLPTLILVASVPVLNKRLNGRQASSRDCSVAYPKCVKQSFPMPSRLSELIDKKGKKKAVCFAVCFIACFIVCFYKFETKKQIKGIGIINYNHVKAAIIQQKKTNFVYFRFFSVI